MFRLSLVCTAGLLLAVPASAATWAESMFEELYKDFGSVQRGPTLSHPFRFTNNTGKQLHISSVRVSCGCVSASAEQSTVEPGQSAVISARMDTRRFSGNKNVSIYVSFDQPQYEEVRLWVQANGRDDISISPEEFALGHIKKGSPQTTKITASFYNSGDMKIEEIVRDSNYILVNAKEIRREGGQVTYELSASIRNDCPVGKWYSDIWLKTNNASMPKIRVPLNVEIDPSLTVSPSKLALGQVNAGAEMERKVIVRGPQPFKITKVQGTDDQISVTGEGKESKAVHVLTVKFKPSKVGDLNRKIKLTTDLKEEGEIEFEAVAQVNAVNPVTSAK